MIIKVFMNEMELDVRFETREQAKKYIATCRKIDKKYNAKNKYKMEVA